MTHKLDVFWIARGALLVLMVGCCLSEGWIEDTTLLGGTYVLSLLSFKVLLFFLTFARYYFMN